MSKSLRIAIADDESVVREYFAKALLQAGHDVVAVAGNGRELVDLCQAVRPDLLITDIRMDGLSGIEVMQELARTGPIPTILLSAHFRADELENSLSDQVIAFLSKPVKLVELQAAVADAASKLA